MTNVITSLLILLQTILQLLVFVGQNPGLPQSFKQSVILEATQTIELAAKTLEQIELQKTSEQEKGVIIPVSGLKITQTTSTGSYKINPKPDYEISKLASIINDYINQERISNGLKELAWNQNLSEISFRHSFDQASDNKTITDYSKPCAYVLIRHEGLTLAGFSLADRLKFALVDFRLAGENIAAIPFSKNLTYSYKSPDKPVKCPESYFKKTESSMTKTEKLNIILENINQAQNLIASVPTVNWINKEWLTSEEIAKEAVNGWMNSIGHRQNILNSEFSQAGIGVAEINDYFIITQVFIKN
ncbi:MAG: CAP domain-containing protein [Patescibacteria group bacterium]